MRGVSPWPAAFLGAAVVGVAWFVTGSGAPAPVASDAVGGMAPVVIDSGDQTAVLARLDGIERRLDALAAAVRAAPVPPAPGGPTLSGRVPEQAGAAAPGPARAPAASGEPLAVSDEALERVVERLERKKLEQRFAKMSNEQMLAEARRLRDRQRDLNGSREILEHLLTREIEKDDRAQALLDLGSVHRGTREFEKSEQHLREAMRVAGEDSAIGVQAGYHLVWTYSQAEKPERGLALADHLLGSSGTTKKFRPWVRWAAARMALQSGDKARARDDYRALLEDYKDSPGHKQIVADARRALGQLE